jgi:hypothetical protein
MKTRIRKKGCPFCKGSPGFCYPVVDSQRAVIMCCGCGSRGPGVRFHEMFDDLVLAEAWSKWNKRG